MPGRMVKKPSKRPQSIKTIKKKRVILGYSKMTTGVGVEKQDKK